MAKFKCKLCGYIHEGELNDYFECPLCHAPATKFEKLEEEKTEEKGETKMNYKGTKTEQNLLTAFAGESQARNKYTYFASVARKEGFQQIAAIFEATANN